MSIRIAFALLCAFGEVGTAQGPVSSGRSNEVVVLTPVLKRLRQEFPPGDLIQLAQVRHEEFQTRRAPNPGEPAPRPEAHSARTVQGVAELTGLSSVMSVADVPRSCEPDRRQPNTSAQVCRFRDANVVFTASTPAIVGDTAVVIIAITSNAANRGLGLADVVVEMKAVASKHGWHALAPRLLSTRH